MSITYKPVVIIMDDFTSRSLEYSNTTLYDAGYINNVTSYDYYTLDGLWIDGYGDVDWVETTAYGSLVYTEVPSAVDYSIADTYYNSNSFIGIYGYNAYSYDYLEWVAHESTGNAYVQHGDWVVDAFKEQLDSNVETILIDTDTQNGGYINSAQSNIAFAYIDTIVDDWLVKNNSTDISYIPVVLSASFGGSVLSSPENLAIQTLIDNFAIIVQSVPNVTTNESGGLSWGDSYSDIINVAAYNVDTAGDSLHGSPTNSDVIDIYANGYVEHAGWDSGWNFGTSFATPRVAAELTNTFVELFDYINNSLATGEITQEDLESSGEVNYSDYVNSLLNLMTTDVYVEIDNTWYDESIPVLSDDVELSALPVEVPNDYGSASIYPITDAVYSLPVEPTNTAPTLSSAIADISINEDVPYSYDASANFTDVDTGDTATYTVSGNPTWLSIDAATGVLSGTPDNDDVATINVTVTRTDTAGDSASDTFALTVDNTNDAPVVKTSPQITMNTSLGAIVFELDAELAPITVENILNYVNSGFYDDTLFHRVISGFIVQGGGFTTGMVYSPTSDPIILESDNGLSNLRGTIAMARTSVPDSATSQFFINLVDNSFLDYQSVSNPGYAVFGEVVSGLSVIDSIAQVSTTTVGGYQNVPLTDVIVTSFQQTSPGRISDASTDEDAAYSYDASANFTDVDTGDTLTYSAVIDNGDSTTSDLPSWLSINSTTGVLSGTPNNGDVGSLNIKVSATDASSASASDAFVLTIDNTNDAPTLSGDFAGSIVEGDTNNLVNTVVIDDVDIGDVLDISLDALIGNYGSVVFDSNFEWTYTLDNNNTDVISLSSGETLVDTFELTVSDGTATISKDIDITINGKDAVFNIGTPTPQTIDTNNPNIDLTLDSGQFVKDALVDLGYASITGLSSSWNANSKTLDLSFDGATNDSLLLIENMPTISLDDIGDVFKASLQDAGLSNIQGFSFAYDEVQRHMELKFDSATANGITVSSYILSAEINPSTKLIEISGSAHNSSAGNVTISNSDLSAGELEAFNALLMMLDAIVTVDLTDTNAIALFGLESLGYSDIEGLSSSWNSSANTLTINVSSATYDDRGISDAQTISVSNSNGDITSYTSQAIVYGKDSSLSQADISDIVLFVLGELGYSSISGFTSNWTTSNDVLTINMDSAYLSGTGSITNVSMTLDLNTSGDVSSYSGQAYIPYHDQWGYLTKSDLTTLELAAIKQTYLAIDALESINGQSTSDDIAMIALRVLGYEQISGLTTSWDREYLTSTIEVNSAVLDGNVITNAKIIASTNSSGYIDYYSSIGTVTNQYGSYNVSYNKYDLNDAEEYVIQAGNYAMAEINGALQTFNKYNLSDAELYVIEAGHEILTEIDRVNSNHNFTNGSATIVFNDDGSIKSYDASIDHSDVGTIIGTIADLDASEGSIVEGVYTEISTIETMVANVQSATSMEDIAKVSLEYTGFSDLTNIAVNWDDDTSTATITFDGLFEGEQRTDPTFVISVGSDGEPTAFSYTADSANGAKQIDLADLNQTQLYGNKVVMKAISDLYDLEQAANHTSKLTNNISFDLYKEGTDTNQDLIIDNGELRINESYSFDTIKIADTNNYTQSINISDAIDVLRHIVDLESFTPGSAGYHAADVNNDGDINISDAIDILRHIVDLEAIDSFDLVDDGGNRVTTLNPTSLSITPNWIMVANGDVNASGEFASDYVMADII